MRFKLECINVLLDASATEPSAPTASDRKQNPQKRCVVCTSNKKEKKADTNADIVHKSQGFVQHHASKLTTLSETEH